MAAIKKLNNLSSDNLSIGQVLKIPGKSEYITYTVKAGDNLYRIAQTYKTTVSEIIKLNNLTTSNLAIGQTSFFFVVKICKFITYF